MNKPLLIVVTGSPASGKTTLAHILARKINSPLISRDELKEGFLNTLNLPYNQLDKAIDLRVYDLFFDTVNLLISNGVSIIIEAAFQDQLWRPKLLSLLDKAEIKIIICQANVELIKTRFATRFLENTDREKYHGDQALSLSKEAFTTLIENYQSVVMDVPTLQVDTSDNYHPTIDEIVDFIWQGRVNH